MTLVLANKKRTIIGLGCAGIFSALALGWAAVNDDRPCSAGDVLYQIIAPHGDFLIRDFSSCVSQRERYDRLLRFSAETADVTGLSTYVRNATPTGINRALVLGVGWAKNDEAALTVARALTPKSSKPSIDASLRWASLLGYSGTVRFLLSNGADVHDMEDAALRWAARANRATTVKLLLDYGAEIHARGGESLKSATSRGHTETVEILRAKLRHENNHSPLPIR